MLFHSPPPSTAGDSGAGDLGPINFLPLVIESETVSSDSAPEALPSSCLAGAAESIPAGFDRYEKEKIAGRYYVPIDKSD